MLVLLAANLGCGDATPTETYELSGRVTEEGSGEPVADATVTFTSDTLYSATTTTTGSGRYEMFVESDVLFGQVRAEREGLVPAEATVYFDVPSRRVDLVMRRTATGE